jgi:hypothetical protein
VLAFGQLLIARALDGAVVDEDVLAATFGGYDPNPFVALNHLTEPAVIFRLLTHAYPRSRSKETLLNAPAGAASRVSPLAYPSGITTRALARTPY